MNQAASIENTSPENNALMRLMYWAVLWSPLRDDDLAEEAWRTLSLVGRYADVACAFNHDFVLDFPQPKAALLFSVVLQREAGSCREEWMRIAEYLGMERDGPSLPPDHLALACEILAHVLQQDETVLVEGILNKYLLPWIEHAQQVVADPALQQMLQQFSLDVQAAQ